jgi:hypothetical protein
MNPCSLKSRRKTNGSALGMDELNSKLGVNKRKPKPQTLQIKEMDKQENGQQTKESNAKVVQDLI